VYSPRLKPGGGSGGGRGAGGLLHRPQGGHAHGQDGRLGEVAAAQLLGGAFEADAVQREAEFLVGGVEDGAGGGARLGQRHAHADFLRSLSGEQ